MRIKAIPSDAYIIQVRRLFTENTVEDVTGCDSEDPAGEEPYAVEYTTESTIKLDARFIGPYNRSECASTGEDPVHLSDSPDDDIRIYENTRFFSSLDRFVFSSDEIVGGSAVGCGFTDSYALDTGYQQLSGEAVRHPTSFGDCVSEVVGTSSFFDGPLIGHEFDLDIISKRLRIVGVGDQVSSGQYRELLAVAVADL